MATIVADCPRCGAQRMTHDVRSSIWVLQQYNWQNWYEVGCHCRNCDKTAVFLLKLANIQRQDYFAEKDAMIRYPDSLNQHFEIDRHISVRDQRTREPPKHLPDNIKSAFEEGSSCLAIGCYNAAACMFRLCVDLATQPLLPNLLGESGPQPNAKQRRDLGLRIAWLLDNDRLPESFRELAKSIREDANDGAHAGTLSKHDADDLVDFTERLLERLITEPKELELAQARRNSRRTKSP